MARCLIFLLTVAAFAAPSEAQLRDALVEARGAETRVWLVFEAQPQVVHASTAPGAALIEVSGVSAETRVISSAVPGPVSGLLLRPRDGGASVRLPGAWTRAEAEVREGGVLVTLLAAQGAATDPAAAPDPSDSARFSRGDATEAGDTGARSAAGSTPSEGAVTAPDRTAGELGASPRRERRDDPEAAPGAPGGPAASPGRAASLGVEDGGPCDETAQRLGDTPWDVDLLTRHAQCLAETGSPANAIGLYERVLAFEPEHFEAALGLARLREARGDYDEAARLFEAAAGAALTDGAALQARAAARRARDQAQSD